MSKALVCALSGLTPTGEDLEILEELDPQESEDGLVLPKFTELPVGWMSVTIAYRSFNPNHQEILLHKAAQIRQILENFPEDQREDIEPSVAIQVEAQFAALEAQRKNRPTILEAQTLYIAPGDRAPGLLARIKELFGGLGVLLPDEEEEEVQEDGEAPSPETPQLTLVQDDGEDGNKPTSSQPTRKRRRKE
jgi:hypothetical protein